MKALRLIALTAMCMAGSYASAQDLIVKKDGTVIQAKVMKVGTSEVEYKKWSNQDGPQYSIAVTDVLAINYKNGEKETFENVVANGNNQTEKVSVNTDTNTSKEETPVIAPDNEGLINMYNNQIPQFKKYKIKDKLAQYMFAVLGITSNSVLSDSHITVCFSRISIHMSEISYAEGYAILIQNKSDETIYIDLANSFKISDTGMSTPYYSNKIYTINKSSSSGGSLNVGAVAAALGVGGVVGTLANGVNVGGGTTSGTAVTEMEERILTIPPHGKATLPLEKFIMENSLTEYPESFHIQEVPFGVKLRRYEYKEICTEQNSTSIHRRIITYSTTPNFITYKRLNIGLYLKGGLGVSNYMSIMDSIKSINDNYLLVTPYMVKLESANCNK